jgi:hypothetical protein
MVRNKHGKAIRQELDKEIRSYGVDPLKTHMSDEEFAAVMEELDRRRDEVDRAVANNPEFQEHIRFMRDTIRYHLQVTTLYQFQQSFTCAQPYADSCFRASTRASPLNSQIIEHYFLLAFFDNCVSIVLLE